MILQVSRPIGIWTRKVRSVPAPAPKAETEGVEFAYDLVPPQDHPVNPCPTWRENP